MKVKKVTKIAISLLLLMTGLNSQADMPKITGTPVVDSPQSLQWPLDQGIKSPNLNNPTSNILADFHGVIDTCDIILSTEGNYYMALNDIWPKFLEKFNDEPLHNAFYTTSPPIAIPQIANGGVQFGNMYAACPPSVAVASKPVIDKMIEAGLTDGAPTPIYQDRGSVILVKRGNPKNIKSVWDLSRSDVNLVTPNFKLESGAFNSYAETVYNIARQDANPPAGWTAEKLFDALYNGSTDNPNKWLEGPRIHHRDEPWGVAYGKADAAVILYHIGIFTQQSFPDKFEIVPLGGTIENPAPLAGSKIGTRQVVALKGKWTPKQLKARDVLVATLRSQEFTKVLEKHGMTRPEGFSAVNSN